MSLIQLTCLVLATTMVKVSEAQCYGRHTPSGGSSFTRTYVPVVLAEEYRPHDISTRNPICTTAPDQSSTHTVLTNDDLNALLLLARVLESDKKSCATNGIDVDKLLETLVTALVYTTTHTVETSMNRCNASLQNDVNCLGLLGKNCLIDRLLDFILGGHSGTANGSASPMGQGISSTTVTSDSGNSGKGLIGLDLGKDGLGLNVGGLVDVNAGGKGSATGTSETSTATSNGRHQSQGTTVATGNNAGHGLANLDLGKDGLGLNVGGLVDVNVGGKGAATGTSQTSTATSNGRQQSQGTTVATGNNAGQGLVNLDLGKDGLGLNVGDLVDVNVGGKGAATGTSQTSTATSYGGQQSQGTPVATGNNAGQGLVNLDLGNDGLGLNVGDLVDVNVGGKGSATASDKGSLGGVTEGKDAALGDVLQPVGGTLDGVTGIVGGLL